MSRFGVSLDYQKRTDLEHGINEEIVKHGITEKEKEEGVLFDVRIGAVKMIAVLATETMTLVTCFPEGSLGKHKRKKMFFYKEQRFNIRSGKDFKSSYKKKLTKIEE